VAPPKAQGVWRDDDRDGALVKDEPIVVHGDRDKIVRSLGADRRGNVSSPRSSSRTVRQATALAGHENPPHETLAPLAAAAFETEAYQTLLARAQRRTGRVPPALIARHVLSVTRGADWPVQRDALEALLRRFAFGRADRLEIVARPPRSRRLGLYATRRPGSPARPYRTLLRRVEPIEGSCDCADFLRSSLGLCKHLLTVLEDLAARRGGLDDAGREPIPSSSPLRWDPVRPLTGPGDWLARIRWADGVPDRGLRRWFDPGDGDHWTLDVPEMPATRLAVVDALLDALGPGRAEPALHALLQEDRRHLAREIEGARSLARLREALRSLKQPLYPYQREGVERFLVRGRLLLADDMGLGKTAQAIAACHALWRAGRVRRGLLVVPAALKPQWLREWQLFTDAPAAVVDGNPAERRAAFHACRRGFLLGNYEQLIRDLDVVRDWTPDIVVLDEAQRIKNWATKTALTVKRLEPPYRLVLTGTPMENRLDELASIVEWVDDLALEPKWRLAPWHTTPVDGKTEISGARNLDTLRTRLGGCMVRRVRAEVLSQLPGRTDTRIPVEMTTEQMEEHDALNMPIAQLLARGRRRPLTQAEFLRLMTLLTTQRIISNGLAQLRFEDMWPDLSRIERPTESTLRGLASPKLLELRELIGQLALAQTRKVVVFSQWRRMLRLAHWATRDDLARERVRAAFFTGEEGQKRRTQNIVDFHDDPACRVLFATDAGGVGLNLQRAASACINVELPWNPAVLEQRIGRIYRLGQRRPIDVYNLVGEPGIESRIAELVGSKQALFTGLFDGTTDEVAFARSGSFLSRIERIVTPALEPAPPRGEEAADVEDDQAAREIDAIVAAGDESHDTLPPTVTEPPAAPSATDVQRLFAGLTVQRTARGGLVIEAPPETASTLAALFSGMAQLLQAAAAPAPPSLEEPAGASAGTPGR
jgi:SNF2 domain-containing protein/helicase-like protein